MRVIVTGSREWDKPETVWGCLDIIAKEAAAVGDREMVVVHGACFPKRDKAGDMPLKSADYLAYLWARRMGQPLRVRHEPHPAKWGANRRAAGILRNRQMGKLGADVCLAFLRDGSPGTTDMIRVAEEHEIPTQVIDYAEVST
jgi:hypothetical protein